MCIYVKFGVGWALHKKGAYAYLSNALTSNVYILDQDKVQIAAEIANVASLAKLYETYGNLWTAFQSELEEANAVFYSNDEELHNTAIGLTLAQKWRQVLHLLSALPNSQESHCNSTTNVT